MLDIYLGHLEQEFEKTASRDSFVELLMKLPTEELKQVYETGVIKLAFDDCAPTSASGPSGNSWLSHFKGSPLYAQAIALEEEQMKMDVASDQQNEVESQERQHTNQARDAIRTQKRLLELELAKAQMAQEQPPMPATPGMGIPPGMTEQGSGAMGDVPPEGVGKMAEAASVKEALSKELMSRAQHKAGTIAKETTENWRAAGRMEPVDHTLREKMLRKADKMGNLAHKLKDKTAFDMAALKDTILAAAKSHPGAIAGGLAGAAHGVMKEDGGLGSGIVEGAIGGLAGHGAQHLATTNHLGARVSSAVNTTHSAPGVPSTLTDRLESFKNLSSKVPEPPAQLSLPLGKTAQAKTAFLGAAMNLIKANPMKALSGAAGAVGGVINAKANGTSPVMGAALGGASSLGG